MEEDKRPPWAPNLEQLDELILVRSRLHALETGIRHRTLVRIPDYTSLSETSTVCDDESECEDN